MDICLFGVGYFYSGVIVLEDINFDVLYGVIVCIVGLFGCGKFILLWFIGGLEQLLYGEVIQIGLFLIVSFNLLIYIFQDFVLLLWWIVEGNILLVLEDYGFSWKEVWLIIEDVLVCINFIDFVKVLFK